MRIICVDRNFGVDAPYWRGEALYLSTNAQSLFLSFETGVCCAISKNYNVFFPTPTTTTTTMASAVMQPWAMSFMGQRPQVTAVDNKVNVPATVAMMRKEASVPEGSTNNNKLKKKLGWRHAPKHGNSSSSKRSVATNIDTDKQGAKGAKAHQTGKANSKAGGSSEGQSKGIDQQRRLWRVYRRKMHREQHEAVQNEQMRQRESDAALQLIEQEKEFETFMGRTETEPLLVVASRDERSQYELVLPRLFMMNNLNSSGGEDQTTASEEKKDARGRNGEWSLDGGFWELLNMFTGKPWKDDADADSDTVSTCDETSMASEHTEESEASWQSWNSTETERVDNCVRNRELLMKHFGGESDSPWLAAKRGDLNALECRWKNRHDWTLEDEFGNVPLYYACKYGTSLRVVLFLLLQWPSTQHIPPALLARCKADAANLHVQEMLTNPCHAEWIIFDFEENFPQGANEETEEEYSEDRNNREQLYNIYEGDEEEF